MHSSEVIRRRFARLKALYDACLDMLSEPVLGDPDNLTTQLAKMCVTNHGASSGDIKHSDPFLRNRGNAKALGCNDREMADICTGMVRASHNSP